MNVNTGEVFPTREAAIAALKADETPEQVAPITDAEAADPIRTILSLYSEWLDVNGLMKSPKQSGDPRTHEELVKAFKAGHGRRPR